MNFYQTLCPRIKQITEGLNANFYQKSWDEFFGNLEGVEFPCVLLDRHNFTFLDRKADNVQKVRTLGFIVATYCADPSDMLEFSAILDAAEALADGIIDQLKEDSKTPMVRPGVHFDYQDVDANAVENKTVGAYGYHITIEISTRHK